MTELAKTAAIVKDRPILSLERMLYIGTINVSVQLENKINGGGFQRACRQDKLIGGKSPVVQ
jgi:hypothetical protein